MARLSLDAVRSFNAESNPERDTLHAQHVERVGGDWYKQCDCGWISRGSVSEGLASRAECPIEQGEAERRRNLLAFYTRLASL